MQEFRSRLSYDVPRQKLEKYYRINGALYIRKVVNSEDSLTIYDKNEYISQDCAHLAKAGAEYYARILDLEKILFE